MAPLTKTCPECGNPIEGTTRFCPLCGVEITPAPDQETAVSSDSVPSDKAKGENHHPPVAFDAVAAEPTEQMDPISPERAEQPTLVAAPAPRQTAPIPTISRNAATQPTQAFAPSATNKPISYIQPKDKPPLRVKRIVFGSIVILLVVIATILATIAVTSVLDERNEDLSHRTTTVTPSTNAAEDAATTTAEDAQDRKFYDELNTFYLDLSSYDRSIKKAAEAFNTLHLNNDRALRQSERDTAENLAAQLQSDLTTLQSLEIPSSSRYYRTHSNVTTCYHDCLMRTIVICEAWEISLSYSNPEEHEEEICAPIRRDNENGVNKYLREYEALYPDAKPPSPSQ